MEVQRIPKRTVSVIEPQKSILVDKEKYHQKRVAAYCRVSTDSEEQLTSYQNQMRVYTEMIAANKEWEFAGLYRTVWWMMFKRQTALPCSGQNDRYDGDRGRTGLARKAVGELRPI